MELNVNNYLTNDLLSILQINEEEELSIELLQEALLNKIERIKVTNEDLPETKENLISFFTQSFFKIVNETELYKRDEDPPNILVEEGLKPPLIPNIVVEPKAVTAHINDAPISTCKHSG